MNAAIVEHIQQLELKLLHTNWQKTSDQLESLLAPEFEEISHNGQVSSRPEVIHWLLSKNPNDKWSLTNFKIKILSPDLVLAIYHAKKIDNTNSNGSIRSSIWQRDANGWNLLFHQASKQS